MVDSRTFLFTDVEGSSRLWEADPAAMSAALQRHDSVLRDAIAASGGRVFKTGGDAFCAVFPRVEDAVDAAVTAERAINDVGTAGAGPFRVRMAIHLGPAESRDGDFFGPTLNRVARMLAAAHGGQILVSGTATANGALRLSPGVSMRDLGRHRLKDIATPERIFQVVADGLDDQFPPPRTLDRRTNNLPSSSGPFVGRETEIAFVRSLLQGPKTRLVTLTGPGGVGKTRLSIHLAHGLTEVLDAVWFVALAAVSDHRLLEPRIAQTLGVREAPGLPLRDALAKQLNDVSTLLVLDNMEQIIDAAPVVAALLGACPELRILVSSREALRIGGEWEVAVRPLELPPRKVATSATLLGVPAIDLFVDRARSVRSDFNPDDSLSAIAEICRRLDGLPLAIELAAARVKILPPPALLARLDRRLPLLTVGPRDLPARHQTLRNTIAWSYDLLDVDEKALFCRLAVFSGGLSVEAAEAVCEPEESQLGEPSIFDVIDSLLAKSLIFVDGGVDAASGQPRLGMLETIREFAFEQLAASGDVEIVLDRHARYFAALAEQARDALEGSDQISWLDRLDLDADNLRAAVERLCTAETANLGLLCAVSLVRYWKIRGDLREGLTWLDRAFAVSNAADPGNRAQARDAAGTFAHDLGDYDGAGRRHAEAINLYDFAGDQYGKAEARSNLATVALYRGDLDLAAKLFEESAQEFRSLYRRGGLVSALNGLGMVALWRGDNERAATLYDESLSAVREIGDAASVALVLSNLSYALLLCGDLNRAQTICDEAVDLFRSLRDEGGLAAALSNRGLMARRRGDAVAAEHALLESIAIAERTGGVQIAIESLVGLAGVAYDSGKVVRGTTLLAAAESLRERIGLELPTAYHDDVATLTAKARTVLSETDFDRAWSAGAIANLDDAVVFAGTNDT